MSSLVCHCPLRDQTDAFAALSCLAAQYQMRREPTSVIGDRCRCVCHLSAEERLHLENMTVLKTKMFLLLPLEQAGLALDEYIHANQYRLTEEQKGGIMLAIRSLCAVLNSLQNM